MVRSLENWEWTANVNIIAACIKKDAEITFECEGADEEAALAKMEELEADNFGD